MFLLSANHQITVHRSPGCYCGLFAEDHIERNCEGLPHARVSKRRGRKMKEKTVTESAGTHAQIGMLIVIDVETSRSRCDGTDGDREKRCLLIKEMIV